MRGYLDQVGLISTTYALDSSPERDCQLLLNFAVCMAFIIKDIKDQVDTVTNRLFYLHHLVLKILNWWLLYRWIFYSPEIF